MPNPLNVTTPDNILARDITARVEAGEYPSLETNRAIDAFTSNHSILDSVAEVRGIAQMLRNDGFTSEAAAWDHTAQGLEAVAALASTLETKKAPGYGDPLAGC